MKVGYIGHAVQSANTNFVPEKRAVIMHRPTDVSPDMDMVLERYKLAEDQGDEQAKAVWFDAYCELTELSH